MRDNTECGCSITVNSDINPAVGTKIRIGIGNAHGISYNFHAK